MKQRRAVIDAAQLGAWYSNPPSKSLVVLAGCDGFKGHPEYSPFANAISKANSRLGFTDRVGTIWCNDYMSELFKKMSGGMTVKQANEYVWYSYRPTWIAVHPGYQLQLVTPMSGFGNQYFTL
jgi:hypothetical protein